MINLRPVESLGYRLTLFVRDPALPPSLIVVFSLFCKHVRLSCVVLNKLTYLLLTGFTFERRFCLSVLFVRTKKSATCANRQKRNQNRGFRHATSLLHAV